MNAMNKKQIGEMPFQILERAATKSGGWKELQEKLGVSRQAIHLWQTKQRVPSSLIVLRCLEIIQGE